MLYPVRVERRAKASTNSSWQPVDGVLHYVCCSGDAETMLDDYADDNEYDYRVALVHEGR